MIDQSGKQRAMECLIIIALGAVIYASSFGNFFVWNDWSQIVRNSLIRNWGNLSEILYSYQWKPLLGEPNHIYRPLVLLSFMMDTAFWKLEPWGYHLTNTVLHLFNGLLVYLLLEKFSSSKAALLGAVLFVAHPVQTTAVSYISGRAELLMVLFLLCGILIFILSEEQKSWLIYLASLPFFFLSLLAKETVIFFPPLLIMFHAYLRSDSKDPWRGRWICYGGLLGTLTLYFLLRRTAMGEDLYLQTGSGLWEGVFSFLKIMPTTLWHTLIPLNPIFPLIQNHLYISSLVVFIMVAMVCHYLAGKITLRVPLLLIVLIGILLGGVAIRHNSIWRDELTLSQAAVEAAPNHPTALRLLGIAYLQRGKFPKAIDLIKKAVKVAPDDPKVHESLALASRVANKHNEALVHYQRTVKLAPNHSYYHWIIGRHYLRLKRFGEAEPFLKKAVQLNPRSSELHNELAYCLYIQGKNDATITQLKEALKILPYSQTLQSNLKQTLNNKN